MPISAVRTDRTPAHRHQLYRESISSWRHLCAAPLTRQRHRLRACNGDAPRGRRRTRCRGGLERSCVLRAAAIARQQADPPISRHVVELAPPSAAGESGPRPSPGLAVMRLPQRLALRRSRDLADRTVGAVSAAHPALFRSLEMGANSRLGCQWVARFECTVDGFVLFQRRVPSPRVLETRAQLRRDWTVTFVEQL